MYMKLGKIKETCPQWPDLNNCDARSFSCLVFFECLTYTIAAQETTLDNILLLVTESLPFSSIFSCILKEPCFTELSCSFKCTCVLKLNCLSISWKLQVLHTQPCWLLRTSVKHQIFYFGHWILVMTLTSKLMLCVLPYLVFFFNLLTDVSNVTSPVWQ